MRIHLNGEPRAVPEGTTVAGLIAQVGIEPAVVAVELNRDVVRRARHADTRLSEGDRVEIVTIVGGG